MLKHGILGLLNYSDMTGYEILETFRDSLNHFWNAQKSQVYRELTTLEKSRYINGEWVEQIGKPNKKIYSITDEGRSELLEWLANEPEMNVRNPLMMKVFFLGERSIEDNILFFEKLKNTYKMRYEGFKQADNAKSDYGEELSDSYKSMFWGFTISYGRRRCKMLIDWCDECIDCLRQI